MFQHHAKALRLDCSSSFHRLMNSRLYALTANQYLDYKAFNSISQAVKPHKIVKSLEQLADVPAIFFMEVGFMSMDLAFVLKDYDLTANARLVYGYLHSLSRASANNGLPYVYASQKTIAERVGICEKTAHTAIKALKSAGLLVVKRRGRGLTNLCWIKEPNKKTDNTVSTSISRTVKKSFPNIRTERVNNISDSKSIYPSSVDDDKGRTAPKGRPTNKRPRRNIEEREKIKRRYKDFLCQQLKVEEMRKDTLSNGDELIAIEKSIDLIASTVANKGKIMVNGALILPIQWFSVVKNITQEGLLNLIYRLRTAKNIKNYRAYFLSAVYNEGMMESISKPWYSNDISAL